MFRRKQKPDTNRNVRPQQSANVFSYYSSRSAESVDQTRRPEARALQNARSGNKRGWRWVAYTPSYLAGLILAGCLVYISTLDTNPKLQVIGDQRETGLAVNIKEYEKGISKVLDDSLAYRSKLLINTDEVAAKLSEKYPELGEIAVILPLVERRPVVQVQPAKPALVLNTFDESLVIDENGRAIAEGRDVESSVRDPLPVLTDDSGLALEQGEQALPKETVDFTRAVASQLAQKGLGILSMTLPAVPNEMHLRIYDRPYFVKFDIRGDSRVQAGTFIATYEKFEADKTTPREYLDVRVPGKVYYR